MIRVRSEREYPGFNAEVRLRGRGFLARCPNPNARQFSRHSYWKAAIDELYAAYSGLCAYTSRHLVLTGSIDHFRPKSKYPNLAYEWSNYRLCRQLLNSRKGDSEDVIDPFRVQNGWFTLDMPSCLIKPGAGISRKTQVAVNKTIATLGLNNDERLVGERCQCLVDLADGMITLDYVERYYPFVAFEVKRQSVYTSLKRIFARE